MADEVSARSDAICNHMNRDHEDSLIALVQQHASLSKPPSSATMKLINARAFDVEYVSAGRRTPLRIPFNPPLKSYSEVRHRLVDMSAEATKRNAESSRILFSLPTETIGAFALVVLYLYLRREGGDAPGTLGATIRDRIGGWALLDRVARLLASAHAVEGLGMLVYTLYKGASVPTALAWSLSTVLGGFPNYFKFLKINKHVFKKVA